MINRDITWYDNESDILNCISMCIEHVDTVLDVGCGIVPINYFRPSLHIMIEPCMEYVDILLYRHADDKSILIINDSAQDALPHFTDNSIDSIFLLDVIEHFEKDSGLVLLRHMERIARKQIVVFTPLGFMPQHVDINEHDAWGLGGAGYQEHVSGWLPEDFGYGWKFHICEDFHKYNFRQELLEEPYGAMFAIKTFKDKPLGKPGKLVNIRRMLPAEIELAQVRQRLTEAQDELARTQTELARTQAELAQARRTLNHPVIRVQRKLWKFIKFRD